MGARTDERFVPFRGQSLVDFERLAHGDSDFVRFPAVTARDLANVRFAGANLVGAGPCRMPAVAEFDRPPDPALAVASNPNRWTRFLNRTRFKVQAVDKRFGPEPFDDAKVSIGNGAAGLEIH